MVRGSHSADGERASRCDICTHRGGKLYATNATHDKGLALRDACFDPVHLQRLLRIGPPLQAAYGIKRSHRIDQLPGVAAAQRENLRAASVAEGEQLRVGGTTAKRDEQQTCVHRIDGDLGYAVSGYGKRNFKSLSGREIAATPGVTRLE